MYLPVKKIFVRLIFSVPLNSEMILSTTEIVQIIRDNPGAKRISDAREYSRTMRRHLYGEGLEEHIETITGYEGEGMKKLRSKYATSNKDLFSRLSRPIDKVFSAKGGSIYLNLPDTADKRARNLAQSLPGGLTVRKWIESVWRYHAIDDPGGVLLVEMLDRQRAALAKRLGQSYVYPTYIATSHIYDYATTDNRVEWIAITLSTAEKEAAGLKADAEAYRLIDDAADYIVKVDRQNGQEAVATILGSETLPNFFGQVPAMRNSDLLDPETDGYVLSFFDPIVEQAENFLLDGSIRRIHKFMHGFPKYVEYASDCHECHGTGYQDGKKCGSCDGTGKKATIRVNDIKLLSWPQSRDEAVIMPADAAAYISPDQTFFDISSQDLSDMENIMHATMWGSQSAVRTGGMAQDQSGDTKTATEVMSEIKPEADRLVVLSEMAEARHKFILDMVIRTQVQPGYEAASVNYGRRYILESPDAIWLRYSDARAKGAPKAVLDTLLNEYYDANYQSDPVGLAIAKKLIYVEPFVHSDEMKVKNLGPDPEDLKAKIYFSEWMASIDDSTLLTQNVAQLREALYAFVAPKQLPEPAQPKALPAA